MTEAAPPVGLAATLDREFGWLETVVEERFQHHVASTGSAPGALALPEPPELLGDCAYGAAVTTNRLNVDERLALILALAPWLRPQVLDPLFLRNAALDRGFTEFGGLTHMPARGFVPTRQTALFFIAGGDLARRLAAMPMFGADAALVRARLIVAQADELAPWVALEPHPDLVARLFRDPG